jgi:hypothetical protein
VIDTFVSVDVALTKERYITSGTPPVAIEHVFVDPMATFVIVTPPLLRLPTDPTITAMLPPLEAATQLANTPLVSVSVAADAFAVHPITVEFVTVQ